MREEDSNVGIITFHCSDNYGAMLQAYGLKRGLSGKGIKADIIRYEPPFMTGRHWWLPYIPVNGVIGCIWVGCQRWRTHLGMGTDFFKLRSSMRNFRERYLIRRSDRKLLFSGQLKMLSYRCYIVGSDQIWNPNITCGLRKVYFGAFENKKKEKVIAYAASLGSAALSQKYDKKFSGLLKYVDVISVREAAAVPYVKRLCRGDVAAVLDPVFLLEEKEWAAIENRPRINQYILVYTTEKNKKLYEYAKKLSQEKGMEVVELRTIRGKREKGFITDDTAGPAEFLGYVHKAAYVVTNSFHGIAFSIIYKKKFLAFPHGSFGTRIENILRIHGLENRIYEDERSIDDNIDWDEVNRRMQDAVRQSYDFLVKNIRD